MKVNMTPNPLDVVTIHASQGDTEARQWEFELHNNGELIDTSEITEQLFFKAYKGGTEQILPENTSTPTTSPFKGDIKYPQGLLSDQEFLYRESPTEEDGLAKITDIKGNTLVWNQLVQNGNFADTSNWFAETGATLSISNNIATISSTTVNNGIKQYFSNPLTVTHKYLIKAEFNVPTEYRCTIGTGSSYNVQISKLISTPNTWTEVSGIGTCSESTTAFYCFVRETAYENVKVRNIMSFDLTEMFGAGNEPSTVEEFNFLFSSIPYYDYNAGTLLSFNGTGLRSASEDESKEDTLSLPVVTYFPTGMKSAVSVYDELTPMKAITRIGYIDMGTLEWGLNNPSANIFATRIDIKAPSDYEERKTGFINPKYPPSSSFSVSPSMDDKSMLRLGGQIFIRDTAFSDVTALKTSLNGVYLYYELSTPTETSFTTASLVTENAEIPLSNEDGVLIGKCTEQLSSESGFIDAKIKLADEDGDCYSNKIQLHVERSPQ